MGGQALARALAPTKGAPSGLRISFDLDRAKCPRRHDVAAIAAAIRDVTQSALIATDINEYLAQHERKELLRFITCGSVDDGKSTLIGRLFYESKMIYEDQLAAIKKDSDETRHDRRAKSISPCSPTACEDERQQGITIDVAYRYFSTDKRKFIIADTPGHEQYTRNMATGASTADLAIILIDARHGVLTQTKRHSFIVSLLGIKHVVVAINKMDLVGYSARKSSRRSSADYTALPPGSELPDVHFLPHLGPQGRQRRHEEPATRRGTTARR